jgi:PAS domain S-box-containing protein
MRRAPISVLVIEDNPADFILLEETLAVDPLDVFALTEAGRLSEGMRLLAAQPFDVVLLDLGLPDGQGLDTFHKLQAGSPDIPVIVLSGLMDEQTAVQAVYAGAQDYLVKGPGGLGVVARSIRYAIQRRQAQAALQASERRFRVLIEHSSDAVVLVDAHGLILYESPSAAGVGGVRGESLIGKYVGDLLPAGNADTVPALLQRALAQPAEPFLVQAPYIHADGTTHWVEAVLTNLLAEPSVQAVVVNYRDITERKRAEKAAASYAAELEQRVAERTADLRRANTELELALRAKDEYQASVSHELRTPLNAILTLAESLQEDTYDPLTERQRKPLHTIAESGYHLLNLINDILDLSKIEAGKLGLQVIDVEIEPLCQASLRLVRQQALNKNLQIDLQVDPGVRFIQADPRRLKQMLVNLLSNAVKFTPSRGHVGLEVRREPQGAAVQLTVWDTGIGITPQDAARLFQPFTQVDSGLARQYGGTGLGLSLVYRMAEMHGGGISLDSAAGKGSRFTISLPWRSAEPHSMTQPLGQAQPPALQRVLIIEDEPGVYEPLVTQLQEIGAEVTQAPDVPAALRLAKAFFPQVILLGWQPQRPSASQALAQLQTEPELRGLPIIILSAIDAVDSGLALGARNYIIKPITRQRLLDALRKTLIQPEANATEAGAPAQQPLILIAEDNLANQNIYAEYLLGRGYRVLVTSTGQETIEQARAVVPALILMDVQLPVIDGMEAARRLRADPRCAAVPIIAITALSMPGDRQRCLDAGMNEYLTKPISLKKLTFTIEQYLRGTAV